MLLDAEVKDDNYADMPRQQLQAQYAHPTNTYLRADAATGKNYIDLNAAAKSYRGAWLFGSQNVVCYVGNSPCNWEQWCPVPAGIADGVLMRGNVLYQNPDKSYRTSNDQYEGVIRTVNGERVFEGETQHTFYSRSYPNGQLKVVAKLSIPLTQRLAYNPMIPMPARQNGSYAGIPGQRPVMASSYSNYQRYDQPDQPYGQSSGQSYGQPQNDSPYGQGQYSQPPQQYQRASYQQNQYPQSNGVNYNSQEPDAGF